MREICRLRLRAGGRKDGRRSAARAEFSKL
jgi:hypothetical protein